MHPLEDAIRQVDDNVIAWWQISRQEQTELARGLTISQNMMPNHQ